MALIYKLKTLKSSVPDINGINCPFSVHPTESRLPTAQIHIHILITEVIFLYLSHTTQLICQILQCLFRD